MNGTVKILIWLGFVLVVFAILWWKGYLVRLANYVRETREELRKCTWPTWEELKGSTVVVVISIALLGGFTVAMDYLFYYLVRLISVS